MYSMLQVIYKTPLPTVMVIIIITILLWGILGKLSFRYSFRNIWTGINISLLLLDIIAIIYVTIISRPPGTSELYLLPFYSYFEAQENSEMLRTVLMNILLFLPLGLSLPNILPKGFRRRVIFTIIAAMFLSVLIEVVQYIFKLGRAETDDVIHNTLGAALGALSMFIGKIHLKKL